VSDATPQSAASQAREEFLTARQLALILQVSESTVYKLARAGRIPSVKITPRIKRFHLQAVREALDGVKRMRRDPSQSQADSAQLSFIDLL
jgi:excisionase family DNA binding protein